MPYNTKESLQAIHQAVDRLDMQLSNRQESGDEVLTSITVKAAGNHVSAIARISVVVVVDEDF